MNPQPNDDQANDQPWLFPMPGENARWFSRFSKYIEMGPLRSVHAVYTSENEKVVESRGKSRKTPGDWYDAAHRFNWTKRAEAYDAWRRKEVFTYRNAQDTERVRKLDEIIEQLHERVLTMLQSAMSEERFNEKLLAQYLAALDLMAKHVGGYVQRLEHTGKNGGKIEVEETRPNVIWYMPEIAPLDDGSDTQVEEDLPDDAQS
jgi:hypothetical protein